MSVSLLRYQFMIDCSLLLYVYIITLLSGSSFQATMEPTTERQKLRNNDNRERPSEFKELCDRPVDRKGMLRGRLRDTSQNAGGDKRQQRNNRGEE